MKNINTPRLLLRKFELSDFEAIAPILADPEVMRFSLKGPLSTEEAKEYFINRMMGSYANLTTGLWAIILLEENCMIGFAGLLHQNIENSLFTELGYRLLPDFWGQGLAAEAAVAIIEYSFKTLRLPKLISIIAPENIRSANLAKRIGMSHVKDAYFHGVFVNIYQIDNPAF